MDISLAGVVVAAACAAIAFGIARTIATAMRRRRQAREDTSAQSRQSRQVRRAQARKHRR
jgi:predicted amino acid dehydrogenase